MAKPKKESLPKSEAAKNRISPFDIVNNINKHSGRMNDLELEEGYNAWNINICFSNTFDTVFFANEMNMAAHLGKRAQYDFYYYCLDHRPTRRGTWYKTSDDDNIRLIMERYNYSYHKAREVLPLLKDKIDAIKEYLEKGGAHGKSKPG